MSFMFPYSAKREPVSGRRIPSNIPTRIPAPSPARASRPIVARVITERAVPTTKPPAAPAAPPTSVPPRGSTPVPSAAPARAAASAVMSPSRTPSRMLCSISGPDDAIPPTIAERGSSKNDGAVFLSSAIIRSKSAARSRSLSSALFVMILYCRLLYSSSLFPSAMK